MFHLTEMKNNSSCFSTAPCTQKVATCISQPVSLTQSLYLLRVDTDSFSHLATVLVYTDVPL